MKEEESGRQMKLEEVEDDGEGKKKKKIKKRNKSRDRWVVFIVLILSILVSLGFYVVSGGVKSEKEEKFKEETKSGEVIPEEDSDFFGSAVYEF